MIWAIERWGHVGLAAGLIQFLEDTEVFESYYTSWWEMTVVKGNYQRVGTPALQARRVLHQLTRVWFPFDKHLAMAAWRKAGHLPDHERSVALQTLLPQPTQPVLAVKADGQGIHLTAHNPTDRDIWLPKQPTYFRVTDGEHHDLEFKTDWQQRENQAFIKLSAGKSWSKTYHRRDGLLFNELAKEKPVQVKLVFAENGKAVGVQAWQGVFESILTHDPNAR